MDQVLAIEDAVAMTVLWLLIMNTPFVQAFKALSYVAIGGLVGSSSAWLGIKVLWWMEGARTHPDTIEWFLRGGALSGLLTALVITLYELWPREIPHSSPGAPGHNWNPVLRSVLYGFTGVMSGFCTIGLLGAARKRMGASLSDAPLGFGDAFTFLFLIVIVGAMAGIALGIVSSFIEKWERK